MSRTGLFGLNQLVTSMNVKKLMTAMGVYGVCLLSIGCGDNTSDKSIVEIEVRDVMAVHNTPGVRVVDVRIARHYAAGHLPNAVNIPIADIVENDPILRDADKIIVYGGGWTDPLPQAAQKKLLRLGYKDVSCFLGGIEVWQEQAEYPVEKSVDPSELRPETGQEEAN